MALPPWLLVVPVLGFLIFVHELGHFLVAKRFGMAVTEFGFGFPPRLLGVRVGETLYSLNLLPLGGFVKLVGEEDPSDPRSFARHPPWKRALVLLAGPLMNLVVPVAIFSGLFVVPQDTVVGAVTITGVVADSPAMEAGLRAGDVILEVDGERLDNHADLIQKVMARLGRPVDLTVRRAPLVPGLGLSPASAVTETVRLVPRLRPPERVVVDVASDPQREISLVDARKLNRDLNLGDTLRQGPMGIMVTTANYRVVKRSYPVWKAVPMGVGRLWEVVVITKNGVVGWAAGGADLGFTGPIGIAQVTGEVARYGISPVLEWMGVISISLAVANALPIPALDGGRLTFVVLEWVRGGKRISPQREGLVHIVGFVLLLSLVVVISYFDVVRILGGGDILR